MIKGLSKLYPNMSGKDLYKSAFGKSVPSDQEMQMKARSSALEEFRMMDTDGVTKGMIDSRSAEIYKTYQSVKQSSEAGNALSPEHQKQLNFAKAAIDSGKATREQVIEKAKKMNLPQSVISQI